MKSNISEAVEMSTNRITVERVAADLGIDVSLVRRGLQNKAFPFGVALKCGDRYTYIIFPAKYREYVTGKDEYFEGVET